MCGRFALTATPEEIEALFALLDVERVSAALQHCADAADPDGAGRRKAGAGQQTCPIAARCWCAGASSRLGQGPEEVSAADQRARRNRDREGRFSAAMRHRRALIPASGFYEWQRGRQGRGRRPTGCARSMAASSPSRADGDWYAEPGGSEIDTGAILTTAANADIAPYPRPHAGGDPAGGFFALARLPHAGAARCRRPDAPGAGRTSSRRSRCRTRSTRSPTPGPTFSAGWSRPQPPRGSRRRKRRRGPIN